MGRFRRSKNEPRHVWLSAEDRIRMKPADYDRERFGERTDWKEKRRKERGELPHVPRLKEANIDHPEWLKPQVQVNAHAYRLALIIERNPYPFARLFTLAEEIIRNAEQYVYVTKYGQEEKLATENGRPIFVTNHPNANKFVREFYAFVPELFKNKELGFRLGEVIDFWLPNHRNQLRHFFDTHAGAMKKVIEQNKMNRASAGAEHTLAYCEKFIDDRKPINRNPVQGVHAEIRGGRDKPLDRPSEAQFAMSALQEFSEYCRRFESRPPEIKNLLNAFVALKRQMLAKPI